MSQTKQHQRASSSLTERLTEMTPAQRRAAAPSFNRAERAAWAARFPEEVPLINGELAWLALDLADLD